MTIVQQRLPYGKTTDVLSVITDTLEALDSPFGLSIAIKIRYGELRSAILDCGLNPLWFNDPDSFSTAYQSQALVSKIDIDIGIDRRKAAIESFWESELSCLHINEHFRKYWHGENSFSPVTNDILYRSQQKIAAILGKCPSLEDLEPRFGPGTTFSCRGTSSTLLDKIGEVAPSVTPGCNSYFINYTPPCLLESWKGSSIFNEDDPDVTTLDVTFVNGSRFNTVPKNAKTFRGICSEPSINMMWQLAIGSFIRKRLKRFNLDLDRQSNFNGLLAKFASRFNNKATIDLKGASDSISYNLVLDLLPIDWVELLSACRSGNTYIDGKWHRLQKWSSMGNGYTFELESLIFFAICLCFDEEAKVFGDDIIVSSDKASQLITTLAELGFVTNTEKTFLSGPFRESCGQDFFLGVPVRPLFIKESTCETVERVFNLANTIRNIARRSFFNTACDAKFRRTWIRIVHWLPSSLRLYGPRLLGNLCIHSDDDTWISRCRYRNGVIRIRVLASRPILKKVVYFSNFCQFAYALYGGSSRGAPLRGRSQFTIKTQSITLTYDRGAEWV